MSERSITVHRFNSAAVTERWREFYLYFVKNEGETIDTEGRAATYHKLKALGETGTKEQVDAIIGSDAWTAQKCDACGSEYGDVIIVDDGCESHYAQICAGCAVKIGQLGQQLTKEQA